MILLISDSCQFKTNFHFSLEAQNKDFQCTKLFSTVLPHCGVRNVCGEEQGHGAKGLTHLREKRDVEKEQVRGEHTDTAELGNHRINEFCFLFSLNPVPAPAIHCNHLKHPPEQTPLALRPDLVYLFLKSEKLSTQKPGPSLASTRSHLLHPGVP